jgi:cytoskeletal protein RodZ
MYELGQILIAGRTKAGMSDKEVAAITRIPQKTIGLLDSGGWQGCLAPAIARGFVIAYCKAVRTDETPALEALASEVRMLSAGTGTATRETETDLAVDIRVGSGRSGMANWPYLAILLLFVLGILVALLTVGTGDGRGDVSQADDRPKINRIWPEDGPIR